MLYGVSYYPEYQPFDRLVTDVAMMREAGLNYVRLADSIWAICEPQEGQIDVGMLQPTLDALHRADIQVMLSTPTYAIPPWLAHDHPEVMNRRPDGRPFPYGDRQNADFTHPTYRRFAERITRAMLERYAQHPAVIGVQVDNETGGRAINGVDTHQQFIAHLQQHFGTLDRLNEVWGLNYWSHRLSDWSQLWEPAGNTNPGYQLHWRRFQAQLVADFLQWQAGIVREYLRADQFVTHDLVGGHGLPHADRRLIGSVIDIASENVPHHSQDALIHPPVATSPPTYHDPSGVHGAVQLFQRADMARVNGDRFLVTEMNPISVGGSAHTYPGYDGQWRLAAYTCISRGAAMVAYWHWHSLHYGAETYSHGVLNHDLEPNRCLDEIAATAAELSRLDDQLTGLHPESDVCFVYSPDSRYLLDHQPPITRPGTAHGDPRSYERIFDTFYRAFFDVRAQATVTQDLDHLDDHRVAVAPAFYSADDAGFARLLEYAADGGHLLLTFRSGYADDEGRARWSRAPGVLRPGVGAGYNLYSNLEHPLPLRPAPTFEIEPAARAEAWMDELVLEGAAPLAYYDHHTFGRYPAVVSNRHGSGTVTYVGTLPNAALGRSIARWVLGSAGVEPAGVSLPEQVRVTRATRDGQRLAFVSNWSPRPIKINYPGTDLLTGNPIAELGAWDVRVLAEDR